MPTSKDDVKEAPKKAGPARTDTKRPGRKGLNRLREVVPNSTSPKCKKVFFPKGMK